MIDNADTVLRLLPTLPYRRPAAAMPPVLDTLFAKLRHPASNADEVEDLIWDTWMSHRNAAAERVLDKAVDDIARNSLDIAETRLVRLLRQCPDYAEAWNKLSVVLYLAGRDDECTAAICRTLWLEPRHFGALCQLGELLLSYNDAEAATLAFLNARRVHPRSMPAVERLRQLAPDIPA
ncbi:MAG: hypothetical protein KDH16_15955 [Rhodocyclaceae bacterium]|nr:hypothetical protein [Rhodocyclaceae bacterium]